MSQLRYCEDCGKHIVTPHNCPKLKVLNFKNDTTVADVCDAAKDNESVFIIGLKYGFPSFYCNHDMSKDEMLGFLERMKTEIMRQF